MEGCEGGVGGRMKLPRFFRSRIASFSILTVLIGTVLVGIALIAIGYKIIVGSGALNEQQKCHLSILAADQAGRLKESSADAVDIMPNIECTAEDIIIEPADVKRSRRSRIDDDLVKGRIAKAMYDCWSMVGAGELDPFRQFWPHFDRTYCMTCADIRFSEDFREEAAEQRPEPYELEGLNYWLATRFPKGKEKSFYEFIYGRTPSNEEITRLRRAGDEWPLDQRYTLVWRFEKQGSGSVIAGVITGVVIGVVTLNPVSAFIGYTIVSKVGGTDVTQGVFMLPREMLSQEKRFPGQEEKKDVCTIMVN